MSVALAPLLATFAIATWRADGILFNNDLTNIESCESPFHRGTARTGEPFKIEMLRSSVDETRGVATAHLLAPGLCWVPWWNDSSVISLQDHAKWWMDTFNGGKPPANATEGYMEFLLKGGDFFGPFAEYAHSAGERAIVSWRMQDYQGMDWMSRPPEDNFKDLSKFWYDHRLDKEIMIHPFEQGHPNTGAQNWMSPAVRAAKLALLSDLARLYPALDGVELDYMRSPLFFDGEATTVRQRCAVMRGFIAAVRGLGFKAVGVRVPPSLSSLASVGLDLQDLAAAGIIDWANFADGGFWTAMSPANNFSAIVAKLPLGLPVYYEVTSLERPGPRNDTICTTPPHERMTTAHLSTTAHVAYSQGAHAISAFNFQYYRPFADVPCMLRENAPYTEPLYATLAHLADRQWVARQDQLYFDSTSRALPAIFQWLLAPPSGGWGGVGRLRLQIEPLTEVRVTLNGVSLEPSNNCSRAFNTSGQPTFYVPCQKWFAAFSVPGSAARGGMNEIAVTLPADRAGAAGGATTLRHFDLALPAA